MISKAGKRHYTSRRLRLLLIHLCLADLFVILFQVTMMMVMIVIMMMIMRRRMVMMVMMMVMIVMMIILSTFFSSTFALLISLSFCSR